MDVKIQPKLLEGTLNMISSKSDVHRCLICSAFSKGETDLFVTGNISEDVMATIRCLNALGATITICKGFIKIKPATMLNSPITLDCGESGTTLRLLIPIVVAHGVIAKFVGRKSLLRRPLRPLLDVLSLNGINFSDINIPFETSGKILGNNFEICGDVSSQFISGLLLASPFINGGSYIKVTSRCESLGYINMTVDVMSKYCVHTMKFDERNFYVNDKTYYISPGTLIAEGDFSNAAFFLVAGAMGKEIKCTGLDFTSSQPDLKVVSILKSFGAEVFSGNNFVKVKKKVLVGNDIDASNIPDLVPILSVLASVSEGETVIYNVKRLRYKESDRINSVVKMLRSLGANVSYENESIIIKGKSFLCGGIVDGCNDHRIIMSAAIASCVCKDAVIIKGIEGVNKSYPEFFKHFKMLGGIVDVV